ncbi:MAG TPA: DUF5615 family PIN-like protein [Burkholderiales bacterium]|nr:DUF5615 family PIN-like protein [Burkholderiales bacterium]
MKFKLDENLPIALVTLFASIGHDADTVPQEGLTGHSDACSCFASANCRAANSASGFVK